MNLAKACEERYGFLQGPRTVAEFDASKGITFLHGYFEDRIVIDRFQVYNNGLVVELKGDTEECEKFLKDIMDWVTDKAGIVFDQTESRSFYNSHLEAEFSASLAEAFPEYAQLGAHISDALRSYGHSVPDLAVYGFSLASEPATVFKIERRAGENNPKKFFCSAPLRTADHSTLLAETEKLFSAARTSAS